MSDNPFKPSEKDIEALAHSIFEPEVVTEDQLTIKGANPPVIIDGKEITQIDVTDDNKSIAAKHIRDTLNDMRLMLQDMKSLGRASQSSWFYSAAGVLAKNLIDGAKILHALESEKNQDKSPKTVANHLHLAVTSDQMSEMVQAHIKKKRNGEA